MDPFIERLKAILDRMPVGCMLHDRRLHYTYWNPAAEKMFEYGFEEVRDRHPQKVVGDSSALPEGEESDPLNHSDIEVNCVCDNATKSGRILTCEWRSTPICDEQGAFAGVLSICQDLTERRRLEEQLRQAQKMETVGLLAGGIAHDFNNLLTIIGGYTLLLMRDMDPSKPAFKQAEQVAEAADRAAVLTSQLLAFSRRRAVNASVLDLNAVVAKMEEFLRRILGEDVDLIMAPGADLGAVKGDEGQIEQIIMNLAVNARWAMPKGGRLTIETANVNREGSVGPCPPGLYVEMQVRDTGHGMDAATRARIFEPFFTTKHAGEGTGLGLATVYGIVKQSGGYIEVASEQGSGTTFRIFFPRVEERAFPEPIAIAPAEETATGTVLLVEDEPRVLETVKQMLTRQGYSVLDALTPESARRICREYPRPLDLLLTDIVLRSGNGADLALELCALRPGLPVVYMSGYPDRFPWLGENGASRVFLQKPFTLPSLQAAIQKALAQALAQRH